jgi:hypothetical protein
MWNDEFAGTPFHLNTPLPPASSAPLPQGPLTPLEAIKEQCTTDSDEFGFEDRSPYDGDSDASLPEGAPSDDEDWARPAIAEARITEHPPVPRPFSKRRREIDPYYAGLQRGDDEIFTQDHEDFKCTP